MKKRISLILAIVMIASVFASAIPFTAAAAEPSPDDIVAEIWAEGATAATAQVKRSEFVSTFSNEIAAVKNQGYTIKLLMDVDAADAQLKFYTYAGKTVTMDGDPNNTGKNAKITGSNTSNPTVRVYGPTDGKFVFDSVDYDKTANNILQYYSGVAVELVNCKWNALASNGNGLCPSNSGSVTLKEGTVLTAGGNAVMGNWSVNAATKVNKVVVETGAVVRATGATPVVSVPASTAGGLEFVVNGGTVEGVINVQGGEGGLNAVKLTAGKLIGSLNCAEGVVTQETAFVIQAPPECIVSVGGENKGDMSFAEALEWAAKGDTVITLTKNIEVGKMEFVNNITINGEGNTIKIADDVTGNIFVQKTDGKTITINDAILTGDAAGANNASSCVFQLIGQGSGLNLKDVTMKDLNAKWYIVNLMGTNGAKQVVNLENVTAVEGIGADAFLSTGNPGGHFMYAEINIDGSHLAHAKKVLQVNKGSTCDINLKNSTIELLDTAASGACAIDIANPESLKEGQETKSTLDSRASLIKVPAGCTQIKKGDSADIIVNYQDAAPPKDDDVIIEIYETGKTEVLVSITRAEFLTKFANSNDILKTEAALQGKNLTLEVKNDFVIPDGEQQVGFTAGAGQTITINGNGHIFEGGKGGNPTMRLHGTGAFVINKLDLYHQGGSCVQYYGPTIDINECTWQTPDHRVLFPTNAGTVNINEKTTFDGKVGIYYSTTGVNVITIAAGATVKGTDKAIQVDKGKTGLELTIKGAVVADGETAIAINELSEQTNMITVDGGSVTGTVVLTMTNLVNLKSGSITGAFDYENSGAIVEILDGFVINGVAHTTVVTTEPPVVTTDAPVVTTDAPGTDAPGTDAPGTDAPGTDAPATDAPETPASDCAGCGGIAIAAQLVALICAAAVVIIKKK